MLPCHSDVCKAMSAKCATSWSSDLHCNTSPYNANVLPIDHWTHCDALTIRPRNVMPTSEVHWPKKCVCVCTHRPPSFVASSSACARKLLITHAQVHSELLINANEPFSDCLDERAIYRTLTWCTLSDGLGASFVAVAGRATSTWH